MDNDTRWNLWYDIILVALKLKDAIIKYQEQYTEEFNKEDILNATNWRALENIKDFLQPFQRVTKEIEGDKATLDKVLYTIDFIVEHFKLSLYTYATNPKLYNYI